MLYNCQIKSWLSSLHLHWELGLYVLYWTCVQHSSLSWSFFHVFKPGMHSFSKKNVKLACSFSWPGILWEKFHFTSSLLYQPHLFHHLSNWLISLQLALLFFTLSGNNNWGDTKSNFMRHESPASGRRSDAPAPASGGSRKYALLNSVFFFCLLVCSKLNLTCWLLYCSLYHILVLSTWVSWYSVHCSASMLMLPSNRHNFLRLYSENSLSILCFSVDFLILLFMYRKRLID